jgi:hypothetical protein
MTLRSLVGAPAKPTKSRARFKQIAECRKPDASMQELLVLGTRFAIFDGPQRASELRQFYDWLRTEATHEPTNTSSDSTRDKADAGPTPRR